MPHPDRRRAACWHGRGTLMAKARYCTYMHTRNDTGKPFYIGKGSEDRAYRSSATQRSEHWMRVANKHGHTVHILAVWQTESEAFDHERFLIACMRECGHILVNKAEGGQGSSGFRVFGRRSPRRGVANSAEHRRRISESNKGRTSPRKGVRLSDKTKLAMSRARRGTRLTDDHKAKLGKPVICVETGDEFQTAQLALGWLRSRFGILATTSSPISKSCLGVRFKGYGFTWKFKEQ